MHGSQSVSQFDFQVLKVLYAEINYELVDFYVYFFNFIDCVEVMWKVTESKRCSSNVAQIMK